MVIPNKTYTFFVCNRLCYSITAIYCVSKEIFIWEKPNFHANFECSMKLKKKLVFQSHYIKFCKLFSSVCNHDEFRIMD